MAANDPNVKFNYTNFCIGPKSDNYGSIDHDNDVLRFKNSSATIVRTYTLSSGVDEIKSIEYPGPRDVTPTYTQLPDDILPIFTLERDSSTQCTITEWRFDHTNTALDVENTITKTTGGSYYFNCYDMAVEYYLTEFNASTVTGTGYITPVDISQMEVGDRLLLGPSSDVTNQYAMEWVEITSISGVNVYIDSITSSGTVPPLYEYAANGVKDDITFTKAIYLFSDIGENNDSNGGLYKLDPYSGSVIEVQNGAIYHSNTYPSTWSAAAWSTDYDYIGFVRGTNLLYVDPNNNYQRPKSQALTNINSDDATPFEVYDLVFDNTAIYRLQRYITIRADNGDKTTTDWVGDTNGYNYHQDTISSYTLSVDITTASGIIKHGQTNLFNVVVRDQFGSGLSGLILTFYSSESGSESFFDPALPGVPDNTVGPTDASGRISIGYRSDTYADPAADFELVSITAETTGGSPDVGSAAVWDGLEMPLLKEFTATQGASEGLITQIDEEFTNFVLLKQIADLTSDLHIKALTKFQFPGGHWDAGGAPSDTTKTITQLEDFVSEDKVIQIDNEFENEVPVKQLLDVSHDLQVSQSYTSRHLLTGHTDTVNINQFQFVQELIPPAWSEKNPIDTNIYQKIRPYGFDLNPATLVYKLREVSYAGDTGYYEITPTTVSGFDAGGGLQGLEIFYNPPQSFHHNAVVYVAIEVYDGASTPNIIVLDYWFKIIPDFKAPYITNESPSREEEDVSLNTNISFDLLDAGAGVDINTLEFYVNNRQKSTVSSGISGGYTISYNPATDFFYGETVEITVKVDDVRGNTLYDMWRFYCIGSTGPWIDRDSFYPKVCQEGIRRKTDYVSANIYGIDDTGVNKSSILIHIGGKERDVKIRPIIYRSS